MKKPNKGTKILDLSNYSVDIIDEHEGVRVVELIIHENMEDEEDAIGFIASYLNREDTRCIPDDQQVIDAFMKLKDAIRNASTPEINDILNQYKFLQMSREKLKMSMGYIKNFSDEIIDALRRGAPDPLAPYIDMARNMMDSATIDYENGVIVFYMDI